MHRSDWQANPGRVDDALKGRACSSTAYDDVLNRINFEGDDTVRDARSLASRRHIHPTYICFAPCIVGDMACRSQLLLLSLQTMLEIDEPAPAD